MENQFVNGIVSPNQKCVGFPYWHASLIIGGFFMACSYRTWIQTSMFTAAPVVKLTSWCCASQLQDGLAT